MGDIERIQQKIRKFRDERDWMQFHNPKDMAAAIAIEATELQEIFLWKSQAESSDVAESERERVLEEVADLAIYLFELADNLKIDLPRAVQAKLTKNGQKYPAEQVRGSSKKYSEYSQKAADAK
jgi:dCTP diphosphatase